MSASPVIERYEGRDVPSTAIPAIGHSRQTAARPGLIAHAHDYFEVCLIGRGSPNWFIEGQPYALQPGWVFVTCPEQVHGNQHGAIEPCDLRWLQIDAARWGETAEQLAPVQQLKRQAWPGDRRLDDLHEAMIEECRRPRPDSAAMLASLLGLFVNLLLRSERESARRGVTPSAVARAIALIEAEPQRRWTLEELREQVGGSRTRLGLLFAKHVGVSPVAYASRLRLRRAQQLLRETNRSVTRIAHELGFSSSQHLATAFRQHYGMTPSEYRQSPQF